MLQTALLHPFLGAESYHGTRPRMLWCELACYIGPVQFQPPTLTKPGPLSDCSRFFPWLSFPTLDTFRQFHFICGSYTCVPFQKVMKHREKHSPSRFFNFFTYFNHFFNIFDFPIFFTASYRLSRAFMAPRVLAMSNHAFTAPTALTLSRSINPQGPYVKNFIII